MDVAKLLGTDFTLRDGLNGEQVSSLAQVLALIERPQGELPEGEAEKRGEEARRLASELFESTRYDIQVWIVLIRVLAETDGDAGAFHALTLANKGFGAPWAGLIEQLQKAPNPAKAINRVNRHVDALFGRLYDGLSYLQAKAPERFERALAMDADAWRELLEVLGQRLVERKLASADWAALQTLIAGVVSTRARDANGELAGVGVQPSLTLVPTDATDETMGSEHSGAATMSNDKADQGISNQVTLRVSTEFYELRRRLDAFQSLLDRKDFEKAALVADELNECASHFDVTRFFPDLFAGLFEGQAKYAFELESFSGAGDTMRARSMKQLYRTALERFLSQEFGNHGSDR